MPHVLIVDDDDAIRRVLSRYLVAEGFSVSEAGSGQDALDYLLAGGDATVILLDLRMPVMDGWAFRRRQRREPRIAKIPVVILSGADADRFDELEAAATFEKPARMSDLVPCVRRLCEQPAP